MHEVFPPGARILEINCGTGNDAVFLARSGMHVTATDISPMMIEETKRKAGSTAGRRRVGRDPAPAV